MKSEKAFGCYKNTIRLISGRYLDLRDPQPDQFTLTDIAGALSKICRFGGQCQRFYSVAEHSVMCAAQARDDGYAIDVIAAALMHDAAEAFIGDVVKPLKVMLPEYDVIEKRMESVIAAKYKIEFKQTSGKWKEIDRAMLIAERRAMFTPDKVTWTGENDVRALNVMFKYMNPPTARIAFLGQAAAVFISDD